MTKWKNFLKKFQPKLFRILISAVFLIIFFVLIYFSNIQKQTFYNKQNGMENIKFEKAIVIKVIQQNIEKDQFVKGLYKGTQEIQIKLLTGKHKKEIHEITNYLSNRLNVFCKKGKIIVVSVDTADSDHYRIRVNSHFREPLLYLMIILFFIILLIIGGKKGLNSFIGLLFTFICIIFLYIPLVYKGFSPIFVAVIAVILISMVSIYCINGWTIKSAIAILGTVSGAIIAGMIAFLFGYFAHLTGLHTEEADTLLVISKNTGMKMSSLLFSGILIASLGAVMDVAISIAASVHEVFLANKKMTAKKLFSSGMHVGRDMMGSMANTLILAFAGTSLNTLIIIYANNVGYTQLMNLNALGIEILQGMSGSIAIILTVPIVSFFASILIPVLRNNKRLK